MEMIATVIKANSESLLVVDTATGNEVRVNFRNARKFSPGNTVKIIFNGIMTKSMPPQISADSIQLISKHTSHDSFTPSYPYEIRGVVIQRARKSLRLRDANKRQIIVRYRYSYHFCVGQKVVVMYNGDIMMGNPIRVNATDIIPICQ
jgi:ribosomal protein L21E